MAFTLLAYVVAKVEKEYVDPEPEQAILAPPANNLRQGMSSELLGRVFIDETGMEAHRRRPRFQIAPNDKGKELIEEEGFLSVLLARDLWS